jgi:MHS family proline/betaine transporter-like MFS transporter
MRIFKSLSREQKEAVGLLQIGTFLEYFDLMLYVHMAVLLNEIFFPKTDPHTASLIAAFAFCSTYVLRPFGAILFGYIGDNIGRKTTVIITTLMMSVSCAVMANLPTYAQIGITATWVITICRIVQGLSSMGEIMCAKVYLTEITKVPEQYPAVSMITVASSLGAVAALGIATLVTTTGFNWRIAFWLGAGIAVIGSIARTRLRETPEFLKKMYERKHKIKSTEKSVLANEKVRKRTMFAFFVTSCGGPMTFYIVYMHFNPLLKQSFGYSSENIIMHNFYLSLIQVSACVFFAIMSYRIHPLKIMKSGILCLVGIILLLPIIIINITHPYQLFALQSIFLLLFLSDTPAASIFIKQFPVLKRVTATSFLYALARALMYPITSFGLIYLTNFFGIYGLWLIMLPIVGGYLWAANHYASLEGISEFGIASLFKRMDKTTEFLGSNHKDESHHINNKKLAQTN